MKFQEVILALQEFWSGQGCILAQPYDVEKGADAEPCKTFKIKLLNVVCACLAPSRGTSPMSSRRAAPRTAAMGITRTVSISIISSRSS